jgi:hypothetical protein
MEALMAPEIGFAASLDAENVSRENANLTLKEARVALVDQYNQIAGRPSLAMIVVQDEFINERMDPSEMIAFAKVIHGLIAVAKKNGIGI